MKVTPCSSRGVSANARDSKGRASVAWDWAGRGNERKATRGTGWFGGWRDTERKRLNTTEEIRFAMPVEPLMPRPIVSVHVRQGDKASEMRLLPFDAYMLAAHQLRAHQPFLKYVWLSTEMEVRAPSHEV